MNLPRIFRRKPKAPKAEPPYSGLYDALNRMPIDDAITCAALLMKYNFMMVNDEGFARWMAEGNNRMVLATKIKGMTKR